MSDHDLAVAKAASATLANDLVVAEREVTALEDAIRQALDALGAPSAGYPGSVANSSGGWLAHAILSGTLQERSPE
jgi:hypothetical protein